MFKISEINTEQLASVDVIVVKGYENDSLVNSQQPPTFGYCSDSGFYHYIDTNEYQWFAKRNHSWTPYGEVLTKI